TALQRVPRRARASGCHQPRRARAAHRGSLAMPGAAGSVEDAKGAESASSRSTGSAHFIATQNALSVLPPLMAIHPMELVWPGTEYLPGYVHALQQGWSPDNLRPEKAF